MIDITKEKIKKYEFTFWDRFWNEKSYKGLKVVLS